MRTRTTEDIFKWSAQASDEINGITGVADVQETDRLVDKATRLFTFLAKAQLLKEKPVRDVSTYSRSGMVRWFSDLPDHPAIRWSDEGHVDGDPLLVIDRLDKVDPPEPPEAVRKWILGAINKVEERPSLREQIDDGVQWVEEKDAYVDKTIFLRDFPDVCQLFEAWIIAWDQWATEEKAARPVREVYKEVFGAHVASTQNAEENELVLGLGLLGWEPPHHPKVRRHTFTLRLSVVVDSLTGQLEVYPEQDAIGLRAELDMLDPVVFPTRELPSRTEERAAEYSANGLDRAALNTLGSKTIHTLDAEGRYLDEISAPQSDRVATMSWSPALIQRPRQKVGLAQAFEQIAADIKESGRVPAGLRPLIDPDDVPTAQPDSRPGALLEIDDEVVSPLPLNDVQRRILERVDTHAQTLVQGPPGTGKTHTAAALLTHLLAQGKRVLVTAETDRALYEVRGKLPELMRPLAVSVIGASRSDMADLKTAVDTISRNATEHDPEEADAKIDKNLAEIERLRSRRQVLNEALIDSREGETRNHQVAQYEGTLASISRKHAADRDSLGWIRDFGDQFADDAVVPTDEEGVEWLGLLRDERFIDSPRLREVRTLEVNELIDPQQFASVIEGLKKAEGSSEKYHELYSHPSWEALARTAPEARLNLQQQLKAAVDFVNEISRLRADWVDDAIHDMRVGITQPWFERYNELSAELEYVDQRTSFLGRDTRVDAHGDVDGNMQLAAALRGYVSEGREIKTQIDGSVKFGMFTPSVVKQCKPFLESVRVNGRAPTTVDLIDRFTASQEAWWALERMDKAWPSSTVVPPEDTIYERAAWHRTQMQILHRVLGLREVLGAIDTYVRDSDLPAIDWSDLDSVIEYGSVVDAIEASNDVERASQPLRDLHVRLHDVSRWDGSAEWIEQMLASLNSRDHVLYARAHGQAVELAEALRALSRRDELSRKFRDLNPGLTECVMESSADPVWDHRLRSFNAAHGWLVTREWLRARRSVDVNQVQDEIASLENRIRGAVEAISALRAWNHAVGQDRLTIASRADLTQYSQLVRKLGKGTGKYAMQRRAEIRESLDRCRPSVPVWIMPIGRVVEQLRISENMFDVVMIDEASQAGVEASFLQYLAPKIVVIGDDKQVSPAAVGIDQAAIRELAEQYLHDERYKSSWVEPTRSLFDEAVMRYGGQLTLTEHRRCVPEIIGFSNRIAYEPEGIRLVPVRQFGANRLEPFRVARTVDAYQQGPTGNIINKGEARALVDAVKSCIDDPAYDGRTFGVISLLGAAQSKYVQGLLMEEVAADDWVSRQLQVGSPADFQGAERDVIFLTMVSSVVPGARLAALTRDLYVQRYNVAVSRAKDQVWLFHTLRAADIPNEQDLRFQLLEYVYGVRKRGRDLHVGESPVVPEDTRVEGFDSLFEQRVYNRIVDRGFTVVPQFEAQGYRIDLVVVGANGRLAIECDGDHWHGPDDYARDLARQRELERCGWQFFRVRESAFYADQPSAMAPLWEMLSDLEIRPSDYLEADDSDYVSDGDSAVGEEVLLAEIVEDPTDAETSGSGAAGIVEGPDELQFVAEREFRMLELDAAGGSDEHGSEAEGSPADTFVAREPTRAWSGGDEADEFDDDDPAPIDPPALSSVTTSLEKSHSMTRSAAGTTASADSGDETVATSGDPVEYQQFDGTVRPVGEASQSEILSGLEALIDIEGPVTGKRLQRAYVVASGGQRVGRSIARELNSAISLGVRSGKFVADNPLHQPGVKPQTYRRVDQPEVRLRELGPRSLDEVPPAEIAVAMQRAHEQYGALSDDDIMRHTLWMFGKKSLTNTVREQFEPIIELARQRAE